MSRDFARQMLGEALLCTAVVLGPGLGCLVCMCDFSSDGDTIVLGGDPFSHGDAFPASSIASNSLAPDGGGMSPNGQDTIEVQVLYADKRPGVATGPDALLLFRTQHDGSQELGVSHFDGSSFTPPAQLRAPDLDPAYPIRIGGR